MPKTKYVNVLKGKWVGKYGKISSNIVYMSEIKGLWLMNFQTFYIQIWSLDKTFIKPDYINLFHSLYPGRMRVNMFSANAGIVFMRENVWKALKGSSSCLLFLGNFWEFENASLQLSVFHIWCWPEW